ncbi:uncharacterized protein BDV14DRAFT_202265 [Aspergillus stella-maris]|uniref:uncharacterized protein n=1 Tax=Aspergillus stella-maris TaxID=1810926 RepID=UPI003CCD9940
MVNSNTQALTDNQRRQSEHIEPRSRRRQRAGPSIPERNGPGITPEFRTHHGTSWADLSAEDIHYFDQVIDEMREGMRSPSQSIGSAPFILSSSSMISQPYYSSEQIEESPSLLLASTSVRTRSTPRRRSTAIRRSPNQRSISVPPLHTGRVDGSGRIRRPHRTVPGTPRRQRRRNQDNLAGTVNYEDSAVYDAPEQPTINAEPTRLTDRAAVQELLIEIEVNRLEVRELREGMRNHQQSLLAAHQMVNGLYESLHQHREALANSRAEIWMLRYGNDRTLGDFGLNMQG